MNRFLHGVARAVSESFDLPGPVLEIGSYQVEGQDSMANLRPLFPDTPYCGVDVRHGPGVDCVADIQNLPQPDASVGTVLAMNTLEHVPRFWLGMAEIQRVLRSDGVLLVSCPFYFHIHSFPSDYWRFTPEALALLLEDYPQLVLGWQGPRRRPLHVWAVAFGVDYPSLTNEQIDRYCKLVSRYARQPLSWGRWLRYQAGRWLCGRRPFAPYLDQAKWETEWRTIPSQCPQRCKNSRASAASTPGDAACSTAAPAM
jgi:SAM-dependent methyltransferase